MIGFSVAVNGVPLVRAALDEPGTLGVSIRSRPAPGEWELAVVGGPRRTEDTWVWASERRLGDGDEVVVDVVDTPGDPAKIEPLPVLPPLYATKACLELARAALADEATRAAKALRADLDGLLRDLG